MMSKNEIDSESPSPLTDELFTTEYGDRKPSEFTNLLTKYGIKTIVDVRSRSY